MKCTSFLFGIFPTLLLAAGFLVSGPLCGEVSGQSVSRPVVQTPTGVVPRTSGTSMSNIHGDDCDHSPVPDLTKSFGKTNTSTLTPAEALARFVKAYDELDSLVEEHDRVTQQVLAGTPEQQAALAPRMLQLTDRVHELYHQTQDLIEPAWMADPQNDEVVGYMLFLLASAIDEDQYEVAIDLAREMMAKKIHEREPILYEMAGIASFMTNKYEVARLCFNEALRNDELTESGGIYSELIPYYIAAWKVELELRKQEMEKNDLPRVVLQTTKGNVVVELFEDQAPNTVANFVYLVEKGFYDNNDFHTVFSGFMAQTGSPNPDGTGHPGYNIPDEFTRPDARRHFRGSLSMAHNETPNSAGSQFFITLTPAPQLDGKYAVFGRVIQGIEIISALERIDVTAETTETDSGLNEPDRIIKARMLRKRAHAYRPSVIASPQK